MSERQRIEIPIKTYYTTEPADSDIAVSRCCVYVDSFLHTQCSVVEGTDHFNADAGQHVQYDAIMLQRELDQDAGSIFRILLSHHLLLASSLASAMAGSGDYLTPDACRICLPAY